MKKRTYVKYTDIEKLQQEYDPNYIIMFGGRNDGKSYAAKEKVLRDFFERGAMFTYLRRYAIDIKDVDNRDYWADFIDDNGKGNKISELSGGQYNDIECEKNKIYLAMTADEKTTRGPQIGYIHALSAEGRLKSLQFPAVDTIIYEEFCTSGMYLYDEVTHFMNYCSTIARDRRITVLLIGNTISRQNAFFREWELNNIGKQQPGSVDIYRFTQAEKEIVIAAYYTCTIKENTMFFGSAAKMITGGEWESQEQPHLEGPESDYEEIYRLTFETDKLNRFLMRFLVSHKTDSGIWYVTKRTSDIKPDERIISPILRESLLYTSDFYPLSRNEQLIFQYIKMGRIAYGDNLTGTEFKRALKQLSVINSSV